MRIGILNYGFGNLCSLKKALDYLDIDYLIINPGDKSIESCDKFILPGVGSFDYGIKKINSDPQINNILSQVKEGKPLLGICLGMQLLFNTSNEGSFNSGLNLIPGNCRSFSEQNDFNGRVPHVGFAPLKYDCQDIIFEGINHLPYMYFIHSYMIPVNSNLFEKNYKLAITCYSGTDFISYIRNKNIVGMQFHPEKSQRVGLQLIKNFSEKKLTEFK